jgi:hypothetical protein
MKYENVCITILHNMLFCGLLMEMVIKQSDRIACLPAWAEDGQEVPKNIYLWRFDSSVTVLRSNRVVGFVWIWISTCYMWPCGLMDKAPASGAGDCRFESCQGRIFFYISPPPNSMLPSIILCVCHCTSTGNELNMLFCGLLIEMVSRQSDRIACLPAWAEDGQEIPRTSIF